LNVGCNELSDKAASFLAEAVNCGHLESIQVGGLEKSLHSNKLGPSTLHAMVEAICKVKSLESLGYSGASLAVKPAPNVPSAETALITLFSKSQCVKMVEFSGCEISSEMMMNVIDRGLAFNSTLTRLDISRNDL
jgi:hypothetical protein